MRQEARFYSAPFLAHSRRRDVGARRETHAATLCIAINACA